MPGSSQQHSPEPPPEEQSARKRRDWHGIAEERIQEAQRNGDFANLRGAGEPLRIDHNVFAGDRAAAYSLLAHNQMAPPEIERVKEIDDQLRRAEELLATVRRHRDALRVRGVWPSASDRRAYNLLREKTETRYRAALHAINSSILSLNIIAPSALHRQLIDVGAKLRAFADEFPPLG